MFSVWIPVLPGRELSPNGGQRSRRNPWDLSEAKLAFGEAAYHAVLAAYAPDIPTFTEPVIIKVMMRVTGKHPQDGYYRPRDPSNIGGDVLKPVLDYALVRLGVIADDDYRHVREVRLRLERVDSLDQEGMLVEVSRWVRR